MKRMKRKVYICPKEHHIADRPGRCPRCGQWLREHKELEDEEINKLSEEITKSSL